MNVPVPRADLLIREIEGETVVLNRADGHIHTLNPTASFIWRQLDGEKSVQDIAQLLADAFAVDHATARADVVGIIDRLRELQLLKEEE
ncbi:MAG: PqqD family protein [Gammaproteobacteria bacterium]|nr:PqqD family protein [Gammaproteobacteria bacterium]